MVYFSKINNTYVSSILRFQYFVSMNYVKTLHPNHAIGAFWEKTGLKEVFSKSRFKEVKIFVTLDNFGSKFP